MSGHPHQEKLQKGEKFAILLIGLINQQWSGKLSINVEQGLITGTVRKEELIELK